jgi:hypothetical protein
MDSQGWRTIFGGQLPISDDIETEPDDFKRFTNTLFESDTEERWDPEVEKSW